jgi:hypothetical protein
MNRIGNYKKILTSFVQVVLFLFSAYGGFFKKIAPPDDTKAGYAVGILSFFALIALLITSAIARLAPGPKYRRSWTTAGVAFFAVAIPFAFLYPQMLDKYTYADPFEKPSQIRLRGSDNDLTDDAKQWVKENPRDKNPAFLARKLPRGDVWTPESIEHGRTMMLVTYAALVLSLATAIFCLLEANLDAPADIRH